MTALLVPPYVATFHVEEPEVVVTCPYGLSAGQEPAVILCAGLSDDGEAVGLLEVYACVTCTSRIVIRGWDVDPNLPIGERIKVRGGVYFDEENVLASLSVFHQARKRRWWHR